MTERVIEVVSVEKAYRFFHLAGVSLELEAGQILGFVGPNGAGKSPLMRILMGMIRHDRGSVRVLGHPIPGEQAQAKRDVGFVSEDMRLHGNVTLAWYLKFVASIYPGWAPYADVLLRRFNLHADQDIKALSHGERVKAMLLLVLARRPRLLLLDEPTTGLDPVARHEILTELMAVVEDKRRRSCSRRTTRRTSSRSPIRSRSSIAAGSSTRATRRRSSIGGAVCTWTSRPASRCRS